MLKKLNNVRFINTGGFFGGGDCVHTDVKDCMGRIQIISVESEGRYFEKHKSWVPKCNLRQLLLKQLNIFSDNPLPFLFSVFKVSYYVKMITSIHHRIVALTVSLNIVLV